MLLQTCCSGDSRSTSGDYPRVTVELRDRYAANVGVLVTLTLAPLAPSTSACYPRATVDYPRVTVDYPRVTVELRDRYAVNVGSKKGGKSGTVE